MKVFHGSDVKIETIDLSKCRIGTDLLPLKDFRG